MSKNSLKPKQPWPTKAVMEQIYEKHLWGGSEMDFYSGEGSHNKSIVQPYQEVVKTFLKSFEEPLIVCDLGCGDFNVSQVFIPYVKQYIGVDIVPNLIKRNQELFQQKNVLFDCIDLSKDELPKGDCALVRQVIQHLSNNEIQKIVQKLSNYRYVILTEHIPTGDFIPNKDKIASQGIRLKQNSGIDLLEFPFHWQIRTSKELLSIKLEGGKGRIVTKLFEVF